MKQLLNILTSFIRSFEAKNKKKSTYQTFNEQPSKTNLFGLSLMPSDHAVENAAKKAPDKTIAGAGYLIPFIKPSEDDRIALREVEFGHISSLLNKSVPFLPVSNRKAAFFYPVSRNALMSSGVLLVALVYILNRTNADTSLLFAVSMAGLIVSGLALLKRLRSQRVTADSFCSILNRFYLTIRYKKTVRLYKPGLSKTTGFFQFARLLQMTRAVLPPTPEGCRIIAAGVG